MPTPNKHTTDNNYRYAFQGQEKDGETGMEAFELRLWDGRLGRWLTVDPKHEFFSPYVGIGNNPISLTDLDGGSTDGGEKVDDHWKIDKNGNAILEDTIGDEIFIRHEGSDQYTTADKFDFTDNSKAFNQLNGYYGKAAGYKGEFITLSFFKYNLDKPKSYNLSDEIYESQKGRTKPPMAAYPEAYPAKQKGILTYLSDGKANDPSIYESKYNLISAIVHENKHMKDNLTSYTSYHELEAILEAARHSSWKNVTTKFLLQSRSYAKENYDKLKKYVSWQTENGKARLQLYKTVIKF